ncbi:PaaI family thioesterase [Cohaesibacter celericrescens]|nr:PaaI family thioesterase [Cohaesibacter celericrescens]
MGATISHIAPGQVDIALSAREDLLQQHGYFHAGVTSTIADSAAGYAAYSLFAAGDGVLTSEFKINLLSPAQGETLVARGRVLKSGKQLTICASDVYGLQNGTQTHVATGLFTLMRMEGMEA